MPQPASENSKTLVWDLPLRIWHWAFAMCICGSLYTGLSGDIGLIEWHQRLGYCMVGLLLFRLAWGIWGGRYARFHQYGFSPSGIAAHFRGDADAAVHTAPGAAIAVIFIVLVAAQTTTGLFATDDIFTEGPLTRYVEDAVAGNMTWIHHRIFWLIITAIAVHLAAHVVYGLRRDPTPLAMLTGRKNVRVEPTTSRLLAAAITAAMVGVLVWASLAMLGG